MVLFTRVGVPDEFLTDCETNIVSCLMQELYKLMGVKGIKTTSYHPEMDGMVERFNSYFENYAEEDVETVERTMGSGPSTCVRRIQKSSP